jgi:microtubule-associated serine/threonine kinase
MKADFIPQLEDEEDTSYFDMRTDRYNHEDEDEDEQVRTDLEQFLDCF